MTRVAAVSVCFLMISTVAPVAQPAHSYSTTSHVVRIEGRDIKYTATAGHAAAQGHIGQGHRGHVLVGYVRTT
jgi:hypothetical protein